MRFGDWLRNSNEGKAYSDALNLVSQVPEQGGLRTAAFDLFRQMTEEAWQKTKEMRDGK